ncbi:MAG: uroporphyrinogen-III C-methyltransferase [Steroidobacteraceae bacterium]
MAHSNTPTSSARGTSRSALIIVGVLALMGLAYSIARVDILRARIVTLQISMETLQDSNSALRSRLDELHTNSEKIDSQLLRLQTDLGTLSSNFGELRNHAEQAQRHSTRSEALYLLRLANDQLRLAHDVNNASDTLTAAELLLRDTGDARIDAIHRQVRTALEQLQALPRSETSTLEQQLSVAEQQASTLKLAGIALDPSGTDNSMLSETGIERAWILLRRSISSLFTIRKSGGANSALLDSDEQTLRRRHLQLLLLNARLAIFVHDQNSYVAAVQAARDWLDRTFDMTDAAVSKLHAQLAQMTQINIAPAILDLSPSIEALTRYLPGASAVTP